VIASQHFQDFSLNAWSNERYEIPSITADKMHASNHSSPPGSPSEQITSLRQHISPTYPVLETNSPIPVSKFPFVQSDPELAYGTLACISHQNQPSLSQSVVRSENTAFRSNQIKKHLQKPSYKSRSTAPWSASCNKARIGRYPDLRGRRLRRLRFARSGQSKCRSQILFIQVLAGDD
jgi:hypothetical protein